VEKTLYLFLIGMACLFPAALYCLFLAIVHHRSQPTMIAGQWDFVGVVLALSGFLLIGGTTLVFRIDENVRDKWLLGSSFNDLHAVHTRADVVTTAIWAGYFIALVGGAIGLMRLRRRCTAIYQITPIELDDILPGVLNRLNLTYTRRGPRWLLGSGGNPVSITNDSPTPGEAPGNGTIEIDGSTAMRHATLRWLDVSARLRRDIETELNRDLSTLNLPVSPASTWLMTTAACIFTMMIFLLVTFLLVSRRD
jgi:hypothetical protein